MITIQISDETGKEVSFSLPDESLSMISRFIHYISFANVDLYEDSSKLEDCVKEFFSSRYHPSLLLDAKFLKCMIDLFIGRLC